MSGGGLPPGKHIIPQRDSLAFHRKHGFEDCGRFKGVGRKFGEDFDIVWMQRHL